VLRTTFPGGPGSRVQRVARHGQLALGIFDVDGGEPADVVTVALIGRLRAAEFDVSKDLPVRAAVATRGGSPVATSAALAGAARRGLRTDGRAACAGGLGMTAACPPVSAGTALASAPAPATASASASAPATGTDMGAWHGAASQRDRRSPTR